MQTKDLCTPETESALNILGSGLREVEIMQVPVEIRENVDDGLREPEQQTCVTSSPLRLQAARTEPPLGGHRLS